MPKKKPTSFDPLNLLRNNSPFSTEINGYPKIPIVDFEFAICDFPFFLARYNTSGARWNSVVQPWIKSSNKHPRACGGNKLFGQLLFDIKQSYKLNKATHLSFFGVKNDIVLSHKRLVSVFNVYNPLFIYCLFTFTLGAAGENSKQKCNASYKLVIYLDDPHSFHIIVNGDSHGPGFFVDYSWLSAGDYVSINILFIIFCDIIICKTNN